ncbi:MAG: hypothetical protein JWR19_4184, partial [Pedosphaera sp.]|nr:hypothetical protein [Pedosphaera sp.]
MAMGDTPLFTERERIPAKVGVSSGRMAPPRPFSSLPPIVLVLVLVLVLVNLPPFPLANPVL